MRLIYFLLIAFSLFSCSKDSLEPSIKGKAELRFQLTTTELPVIETRATALPDVDKFTIMVTNTADSQDKHEGTYLGWKAKPLYLEVPDEGATYLVESYSCPLKDIQGKAVFDKPCFYDSYTSTLYPNNSEQVQLECSLQQFQVSFEPTDKFLKAFKTDEQVEENNEQNPEKQERKFQITVADAKDRSLSCGYKDLDKSVYFDATEDQISEYITITVTGTTLVGNHVEYTTNPIYKNDKTPIKRKDHLLIKLDVSDSKAVQLKAITIE